MFLSFSFHFTNFIVLKTLIYFRDHPKPKTFHILCHIKHHFQILFFVFQKCVIQKRVLNNTIIKNVFQKCFSKNFFKRNSKEKNFAQKAQTRKKIDLYCFLFIQMSKKV